MNSDETPTNDEASKVDWAFLQRGMRAPGEAAPHDALPVIDLTKPPVKKARALRRAEERDVQSLRERLRAWWHPAAPPPE